MGFFWERTKFIVNRGYMWHDQYEIRVAVQTTRDNHDAYAIPAAPLEFRVLKEEERGLSIPPLMSVPQESAQQLMDELWNAGLRPTEGTGSSGALAATQKHLEDMKAVAWHALKITSSR